MKKKEIYRKAKEAEYKAYKRIQAFVLSAGVLSFLINWRIGLVGCLLFIWNDIMFDLGNREHLAEEYENGYVPRGLRMMFKSWGVYIIFAAVMLWLLYSAPVHQWS